MEAVTWVALGILTAALFGMFGAFFHLGTRIDALGAELRSETRALGAELRSEIRGLGTRLDAHIERHTG